MLGFAALEGWAPHCSQPGSGELSPAVSAESSSQPSQRPPVHPYVHYTDPAAFQVLGGDQCVQFHI